MNYSFDKKFVIPEGSTLQDAVTACSNVGAYVTAKMFDDGNCLLTRDKWTTCNNFFDRFLSEYDRDYYRAEYDDDDDYDEYECDDDDISICNEGSEIGCSLDDPDDDDECEDDCGECDDRNVVYYSKEDHINAICVLMGKIVAQEIVLGKAYDNSAHILSLIDDILFSMSRCGFFGLDLVFNDEHREQLGYSGQFRQRLSEEFNKITTYCYNRAKVILTANEAIVRDLISRLLEWEVLDDEDVKPFLTELGGLHYVEYRG